MAGGQRRFCLRTLSLLSGGADTCPGPQDWPDPPSHVWSWAQGQCTQKQLAFMGPASHSRVFIFATDDFSSQRLEPCASGPGDDHACCPPSGPSPAAVGQLLWAEGKPHLTEEICLSCSAPNWSLSGRWRAGPPAGRPVGKGPRDYEVRRAEGSAQACSSLQPQPTVRKIGTLPHLQAGPPQPGQHQPCYQVP